MKKMIVAHAFVLSIFSSLAFAEGGADRVFERNEARVKEALAAQKKTPDDIQKTVRPDIETGSASSC